MWHSRHLPQCFRGLQDGRVGQEVLLSLGDPSCPLNPIGSNGRKQQSLYASRGATLQHESRAQKDAP